MDDNKKKNAWDSLIEDLGVQPEETAYERHQPEQQTIESTEVQELAPAPEAKPGDWNALASTLGVEVDAVEPPVEREPVVAEPQTSAAAPQKRPQKKTHKSPQEKNREEGKKGRPQSSKEPVAAESFGGFLEEATEEVAESEVETEDLPPLPSQIDQALSESSWDEEKEPAVEETSETDAEAESGEGISGEAARSAFDALFSDGASGWGSAFLAPGSKKEKKPAAEQSEDSSDPLDAKVETPGEEEESDRPKRKRSRRRRRGGRGRKSAGERTGEEAVSTEGSESVVESGGSDSDSGSDSGSESGASTGETKKRRRRRSRGGARRRGAEEKVVREDDDSVDDLSSLDDDTDGELGDELGERHEGGQRRTKHRSIPAWSEAIGMIVDANLEQRAKSPSHPQSSRGGRGGRGGRRRRKPESK